MVSLRELFENSFSNEVEDSIQDAIMMFKIKGIHEVPVETFLNQIETNYSVELDVSTLSELITSSGLAMISGDIIKLTPQQETEDEEPEENEVDKMAEKQSKKDLGGI